ncbi:MAG TPA: M48 family metalloprotease, partial [Geobacteraceae bacterium]
MKKAYLTILAALVCFVAADASAGLFEEIEKFTSPDTKEGKILSGATQVLSSAKDMDYKTECTIGESLALEGLQRFGKPVENEGLQKYVNLVGNALAANSRRSTIPYQFAVLDSKVPNAFAAPGGVIFISKALLDILENESELAAVLAHEVGHVAGKHAIRSIRRAQFLEGAATITAATMKGNNGKQFESMIGDMQKVEASSSDKKGSWFSTHPPLDERIDNLQGELKKYPDRASLAKVKDR